MSNIDMVEDAEFENQIDEMGDDQLKLTKFVARQVYAGSKIQSDHGRRIKSLERQNKKLFAGVGGASAFVATVITAAFDYFMRRPP